MPTIQFNLTSFTNKNADLKAGASFSAYASGNGVANAMILAARLTLNNIRVYSAQLYLELAKGSGTGATAAFSQNSSIHNQTVNLSSIVNAVAQAGDGPIVFTVRATSGSTGNLLNLRDNVSGVLEIDYFIPQSDFSLDKTELDAGQTITATIMPTHADADHEIIWRFQTAYKDYSSIQSDSTSYTAPFNKSLTVPLSWLDAIPDTESGLATCTVNTYMGGVLTGSVTKQFAIKAGAAILPSITSLTATRINNGVPSGWAEYVQSISGVRLTANGVAGIYGSSIVETKITGGGYTGLASPYDTGAVNAVGDVVFTCEVKDSRGRKKSATATVTFRAYERPQITAIDTVRCNSDGTPNDSGTYVKATVAYIIASVNGKNSVTSMVTSRRPYTGGDYVSINTSIVGSGTPYIAGSGFDAGSSYVVRVELSDALNTFGAVDIVPTESWMLHYRVGGRGVAVGMRATRENAFEVNPDWEIYYKGQTLDDRFGGSAVTWDTLTGKPSTFPPSTHNHDSAYAAVGHNHDGSYVAKSGDTVTGAIKSQGSFNQGSWGSPTSGALTQVTDNSGNQHSVIVGLNPTGLRRYGIDFLDSTSPVMRLYSGNGYLEINENGQVSASGAMYASNGQLVYNAGNIGRGIGVGSNLAQAIGMLYADSEAAMNSNFPAASYPGCVCFIPA